MGEAAAAAGIRRSGKSEGWKALMRGWAYLVWFLAWGPLRRHSMTFWVAAVLTAALAVWVTVETQRGRWELRQRRIMRGGPTYGQVLDLAVYEKMLAVTGQVSLVPTNMAPVWLVPAGVGRLELIHRGWSLMYYTLWVVHGAYLGFLLPLLALACVNSWMDPDSEAWVWLWSRPLPRCALYLAQWLGTLPWTIVLGVGAFGVLALCGGVYGRWAWRLYISPVLVGLCAFTTLFHFIHAFFRKPIVVGLIYVFFFETLVGSLPGSLKLLSLTFHVRSWTYNIAKSEGLPAEILLIPDAVAVETSVWMLAGTTICVLIGGLWLYGRQERPGTI